MTPINLLQHEILQSAEALSDGYEKALILYNRGLVKMYLKDYKGTKEDIEATITAGITFKLFGYYALSVACNALQEMELAKQYILKPQVIDLTFAAIKEAPLIFSMPRDVLSHVIMWADGESLSWLARASKDCNKLVKQRIPTFKAEIQESFGE